MGPDFVLWKPAAHYGLYFFMAEHRRRRCAGCIYTTPSYGCTADNWRDTSTSRCRLLDSSLDPNREKEDIPRVMAAWKHSGPALRPFSNVSFKLETGLFLPGFWHVTVSWKCSSRNAHLLVDSLSMKQGNSSTESRR